MIKAYTSPGQELHNPSFEIYEYGQSIPYYESPLRLQTLLQELPKDGLIEIINSKPATSEQLTCHTSDYLSFLESIFEKWRRESPSDAERFGSLFPVSHRPTNAHNESNSIPALLGTFVKDLSAPITSNTWQASLASAGCALSGANTLVENLGLLNKNVVLSLNRPPGHHAGSANCAGYCYINNAALAATKLASHGRVSILDIDYHAGNGTQQIFYENSNIDVCSIHADPSNEYPYFAGFASETGAGAGIGHHHNVPLPHGTQPHIYTQALMRSLDWLSKSGPSMLVLSAGFDTYRKDPLGSFQLETDSYFEIGKSIAQLGIPILVILEGGYYIPDLPQNLLALAHGLTD